MGGISVRSSSESWGGRLCFRVGGGNELEIGGDVFLESEVSKIV